MAREPAKYTRYTTTRLNDIEPNTLETEQQDRTQNNEWTDEM